MTRIYHHYETWEDWRAGLYRKPTEADWSLQDRAARLLKDPSTLEFCMRFVGWQWPNAAEQNLTNLSRNKQAWFGQAACCWWVGAPEEVTKAAWWTLTDQEREAVNAIADKVYSDWQEGWRRKGKPCLDDTSTDSMS